MLVRDNRMSSVNGAFGRHERHDSAGMRLITAAFIWQAGHRTHRNQYRAVMAAPIVGENSISMRLAWRSFH
jgi:hypothetical protein